MVSKKSNFFSSPLFRTLIVVVVIIIALILFFMKSNDNNNATPTATKNTEAITRLPRLLDLGSDKCIPCKMMEPVLEELEKEYAGKLDVQFINVRLKPEEAATYAIDLIPTQIFYSEKGTELFRHVGFFSKEEILQTWRELGYSFD